MSFAGPFATGLSCPHLTKQFSETVYKEGVITPSYRHYAHGRAFAARSPGRETLDFFVDWRGNMNNVDMMDLQDPTKIKPLVDFARPFAAKHENARFTVLRLWSASDFYPFTIGWDKREYYSFMDNVERTWDFKFIPKDTPYSEWSVHHNARLRVRPYEDLFEGKVVVRRDAYLVMAENEEECLKLSTALTWVIQTRPWRLEVDLWRSFGNANMNFIEKLHGNRWLD